MRRRAGLGWLALFALGTLLGTAWAQPHVRPRAERRPARPLHAPLIGARPELPPLPAEYLTHERAGIRFAYHPSSRDRVRPLIESAAEVRQALRSELNQPILGTVEVRVAMTEADFGRIMPRPPQADADTAQHDPSGHSWSKPSGAPISFATPSSPGTRPTGHPWRADASMPMLAFAELSLLVMNVGTEIRGELPDPAETFRHGLAHLALDEATGSQVVPKWFHEGYATRFANETSWSRSAALGWASTRGSLVPTSDLDAYLSEASEPNALGRAHAADFVGFLLDAERPGAFSQLVLLLKTGTPYAQAVRSAYHADERRLERAWQRDVARRTVFVPVLLGGILCAALLTASWRLRQRRRVKRQQQRHALARTRAVRARPAPSVAVVKVDPPGKKPPPKKEVPLGETSDAGVPKVSHDGQWHTLH